MPNDPFVILGIDRNATQSEIEEAYKSKKEELKAHLFDEGESGAEAARQLELLEGAYNDAMESTHENAEVSGDGESNYEAVKQAIRDKNVEQAQRELDKISYRGPEWHYMQSIVFYEKNWLNDSRNQLEIALQMEPSNAKYQKALDNLKKKMDGSRPYDREGSSGVYGSASNPQQPQTNRSYSQAPADATDGCCAACQALWCADCCCECMGGDLIRCC